MIPAFYALSHDLFESFIFLLAGASYDDRLQITKCLGYLLNNFSLMLLSDDVRELSTCAEALRALAHPFELPHVYVDDHGGGKSPNFRLTNLRWFLCQDGVGLSALFVVV